MTTNIIAFLDKSAEYCVAEDRGVYEAAATDDARHLHEAQGRIGEALNLAGLLLAALEDQGDRRAMQVYTAVRIIEKKLEKACDRLDRHEAEHATLLSAHTDRPKKTKQGE